MWKTTLRSLPLHMVARGGEATLPLFLAAWFGGSRETDLYFFALAVFKVAGSLVFAAFQDSALVPILAEMRGNEPERKKALMGSLLGHTLVYGGGLSALIFVSFAAVCCARYHGADRSLSLAVAAPLSLLLVVTAVRSLFSVFLNAERRFSIAPFSSALSVLATILTLTAGRSAGVLIVPFALLAGEIVAAFALSRALGGMPRPTLRRSRSLGRFARLATSELLGGAIARMSPLTDQVAASLVGVVGGGTLLTYSGDVAMAPTSLLAATLFPVMLTHVSAQAASRDLASARESVNRALFVSIAVLALSALALSLAARPLLSLVYARGAVDARALSVMTQVFPYQVLCLVPFGAVLILSRAHVALQNSAILPRIGALAAVTNLAFDLVLGRAMGLCGIALATAFTHVIVATALYASLDRAVRSHVVSAT